MKEFKEEEEFIELDDPTLNGDEITNDIEELTEDEIEEISGGGNNTFIYNRELYLTPSKNVVKMKTNGSVYWTTGSYFSPSGYLERTVYSDRIEYRRRKNNFKGTIIAYEKLSSKSKSQFYIYRVTIHVSPKQ